MKNNQPHGSYAIPEFLYSITDLCALVIDGRPEPMLAIDKEHRIVLLNKAGERWLQRSRQELLNRSLFSVLPAAGNDGLLEFIDNALHRGPEDSFQSVAGDRHFQWRTLPMADKFGVLHGVICTMQDITQQVLAEQRIRALEGALREKELLLSNRARMAETIIDASNDLIMVLDRSLRFCAANKSYQQYSGLRSEDLMGRVLNDVFPRVNGSELLGGIYKALQGEPVSLQRVPCSLRQGRCNISLTPLSFGELVYGVLVMTQLSEQ
jgi:PAS domain S-box-containing protein